MRVTGIDHIYVSVADFERSRELYDRVMNLLGLRKGTLPIGGEPHCHYFNPETQYTIRPPRRPEPFDSGRPGLHHLCFRVPGRAEVDEACAGLRALGIDASEPKLYPVKLCTRRIRLRAAIHPRSTASRDRRRILGNRGRVPA